MPLLLANIPLMVLFFALWVGIPPGSWPGTRTPAPRPPRPPPWPTCPPSRTTPATSRPPDPRRGQTRKQPGPC